VAFFDVPYNIYMSNGWAFTGWCDWAYKLGNFNELVIPDLIQDLQTEGKTTWANDVRQRWENKVKFMTYDNPYPYTSEMTYDTTAFESTHAISKYGVLNVVPPDSNEFYDKNMHGPGKGGYRSHPIVQRRDFVNFMQREILANKATRETIAPSYSQLGSDLRGLSYSLSYMTQMGGWGLFDYALYFSATPAEDLRTAYACYLAPFCLIHTGDDYPWWPSAGNAGALAWGFQNLQTGVTWPGFQNDRGPWMFDGENDAGIGGAVRTAASVVVADPIFGLIGYGAIVQKNPFDTTIIPKDGIRQRFHMLNASPPLHLQIDRDGFNSITVADDLGQLSFVLTNRTGDGHLINLMVQGLTGSSYGICVDAVRVASFAGTNGQTQRSFQVTNVPVSTITIAIDSPAVSNIQIAGDAVVGGELSASYNYFDPNGSTEGSSIYQWYRSNDNVFDPCGVAIPGATNLIYSPHAADVGKFLFFQVIPVANDRTVGRPGRGQPSLTVNQAGNHRPTAIPLRVDVPEHGSVAITLQGADLDGRTEGRAALTE
jgi:hypothetical protein